MSKPWLEAGPVDGVPAYGIADRRPGEDRARRLPRRRRRAVRAAHQRLLHAHGAMPTGRPLPMPRLLWLNTGVLVAEQRRAAMRRRRGPQGADSTISGWRSLAGGADGAGLPRRAAAGLAASWPPPAISLTDNPADSFFYLLTALHGLHILGGLVALGRTDRRRMAAATGPSRLRAARRTLRHLLAFPARSSGWCCLPC